MKKLLPALFVLALLGAGCWSSSPAPTNTQPTPAPVNTAPNPTPAPVVTPTPSGPRMLTAATTDSTWKTYANSALGFSFMTPTKGRYAPEWEVKTYAMTDALVKDGCFSYEGEQTGSEKVQVGETVFCHTMGSDNGAGQHYVLDSYAFAAGKTVVVLQFVKHTVNAGMMDCPGMTEPYSTSGSACIPFVPAEYQATADGIVGTFKLTK